MTLSLLTEAKAFISSRVVASLSPPPSSRLSVTPRNPPINIYLRPDTRLAAFTPNLPNFCADCGNDQMVLKVPDGDERIRACCEKCGRIEYQNPKVVVACVIRTKPFATDNGDRSQKDLILVAKRAIEPRQGTWGIPQGFMENGETTRQAAVREVYEETGAVIDPSLLRLRAVYNVPGSVQLVYEARVDAAKTQQQIDSYHDKNHESLEVALLSEEALAEKELCFPTVQWALDHCRVIDDTSETNGGAGNPIQQMTKFYDAVKDEWNQYEDEPLSVGAMENISTRCGRY